MRTTTAVLAILFIVSRSAAGQSSSTSYFPLADGNSWSYITVLDPPNEPPDTLDAGTFRVLEPLAINDTLYYRVEYPFAIADTLRCSEDGNIWAWVDGEDVLLFDFTLEEGVTYTFRARDHEYEVTANRRERVAVSAGTFEDVISLGFDDPEVMDEETSYSFAKGTGIISASGQVGDYVELHEATLYPIPDPLDWHGYFPLEIGTRWQYEFKSGDIFGYNRWIEDWLVAGDSTVDGTEYHMIEVSCDWIENSITTRMDCKPEEVEELLVRLDEDAANVLTLQGEGGSAAERFMFHYDFALDAPFHFDDDPDGDLAAAYYYYRLEDTLILEGDDVPAPRKGIEVYSSVPGHIVFAHGVGLVSRSFSEGGTFRQMLVYADVAGRTYGSLRPVAAEPPADVAAEISLSIYPNPALSELRVEYSLPASGSVAFEYYDVLGRRVLRSGQGPKPSGRHSARLDVDALAAGMYGVALIVDGTRTASTSIVVAR